MNTNWGSNQKLEEKLREVLTWSGNLDHEGSGRVLALKLHQFSGQDYYHVLRANEHFLPHPVGVQVEEDEKEAMMAGYLMLAPEEADWSVEKISEEWFNQNGRLKPTWRDRLPAPIWVMPDGSFTNVHRQGVQKMWWQATPFCLCLNCGEFYTARETEFAKLATLSSEGRTSANTVLAISLLRYCQPLWDSTRQAADLYR